MEVVRIIGALGVYPGTPYPEYETVCVELPDEVFAYVYTEPGKEEVRCLDMGTWATYTKHGLVPGSFAATDRSKKLAKQIVEGLTRKPEGYDKAKEARKYMEKTYKKIEKEILDSAEAGYKEWLRKKK